MRHIEDDARLLAERSRNLIDLVSYLRIAFPTQCQIDNSIGMRATNFHRVWRAKLQSIDELKLGFMLGKNKKRALGRVFLTSLADQAGFEPAEGFTPRTLSRRVT